MKEIESQNLAQLLNQLRFTPPKKRSSQLAAAEKLLEIIEPDKKYPFEFVCYRITSFQPKGSALSEVIPGKQLTRDLGIFISQLSKSIAEPVALKEEKIYTIEELSKKIGVSVKTITRWRSKGLAARKYIFKDHKKLYGFTWPTVERFFEKHPKLASRAKKFNRMTPTEKNKIIKKAKQLAVKKNMSRHRIIRQISTETGRSHETIRYTLSEYDKGRAEKKIFSKNFGKIDPEQTTEIYRLYKQDTPIEELTMRFKRSKSSIYRLINLRRARNILSQKIDYIASNEFIEETKDKILSQDINIKNDKFIELKGTSLVKYLTALRNVRLLNREQEMELFRRYNFLKYLAVLSRAQIRPPEIRSSLLNNIEKYLAEAETIKKMIIESNLLLVVNIGRKHSREPSFLTELISEGNISLMKAVEKFDYTRGFRFSTFASWVIAKDFARKIPAEKAIMKRAEILTDVERDRRITEGADFAAIEQARSSLVDVIKNELDEREQYIILNHFALTGSRIKKKKKTLKEIGEHLDISRERVRQIELQALQKLRQRLSIEQFELLTG